MKGSLLLFLMLWLFWTLLTGFNPEEIIAGIVVSAVISIVVGYGFLREHKARYVKGFLFFMLYIPYYLYQEVTSNLQVMFSILTGRINPGIFEVPHSHTHEWGITMLSNSITMTPGTLTLEAEPEKLYVHCLNSPKNKNQVVRKFERMLKRIWD